MMLAVVLVETGMVQDVMNEKGPYFSRGVADEQFQTRLPPSVLTVLDLFVPEVVAQGHEWQKEKCQVKAKVGQTLGIILRGHLSRLVELIGFPFSRQVMVHDNGHWRDHEKVVAAAAAASYELIVSSKGASNETES
jgi:hypothetical protein